jgi:DNA-binding winged helix-turn-helix (wHTH) protein/TolB-like protein
MSSENHKLFSFDDVTVDCENFRVLKAGVTIALTPRAFDVLMVLLRHAESVVEKKELFDQVWQDAIVSDNALTKIIKELRHALGDDANDPRYIETVPRRGYRFIGKVEETSHPQVSQITPDGQQPQITSPRFGISTATRVLSAVTLILSVMLIGWLIFRQKTVSVSSSRIRSIAVLPFKSLNSENRDESLEMGMADTLITRLSNLKELVVRPITASRKYSDLQQDPVKAGQEIQVDAVLDGSIQRVGERVRVTVRLTKVSDSKQVWSETFDENFNDILKVQDSIAERVTTSLSLQLSNQEKEQLAKHLTDNADAYQFYLRGQLLWNSRRENWIEQSLADYQKALEKDPTFALAHIGVADCYISLSGHREISMPEAEAKARPHIMMALKLDDKLAQAHNALAELKYQYEYDWSGAEREFKKAIELNPNVAWIRQAYGWFLMSAGRFSESEVQMDKARELDPSSLTVNVGRGRLFYYTRQYDQALQHFQNIIAVEPNDHSAYFGLYTVYEQKQMYEQALEVFLQGGHSRERAEEFREIFRASGWPGVLRKRLERLKMIAKTDHVEPYQFADLYVRLGQKDEAFAWFEKAFAERDAVALQFKIEPAYDSLRNDPRYSQLLRKINLQP